jgi:hypothetical protein
MDPIGSSALAATGLKTAGSLSPLFGNDESVDSLKSRIVPGIRVE